MPSDAPAKDQQYKYLHLGDFTPGLYDSSYVSGSSPILDAPPGSANADHTWACAALPSGGLGPLPRLVAQIPYTIAFPGSVSELVVTMVASNPSIGENDTEIIFGLEGDDGTTHYGYWYSYVIETVDVNLIHSITCNSFEPIYGSPYPQWTRMADGSPIAGTAPSPALVFSAVFPNDGNGLYGHLFVYPSRSSMGTFGVDDLEMAGSNGPAGPITAYDGRILAFGLLGYTWPAGPLSQFGTNEAINFTDPPESNSFGGQQTVVVPEDPFGIGCAGSISAGELFLVKKVGGGVFVTGDIDNPSAITYLPGVQPTGWVFGHGDSGDLGFFYCSYGKGAWLWNGGNTSQKISNQLRDNFFDVETNVIDSSNYGFFVKRWGDFMLFSNNFLYDERTSSWWRLDADAANGGTNYFHYVDGFYGTEVWASPLTIPHVDAEFLFKYDNTQGAEFYQWRSLPIHVTKDADHVIDVRRIIVRASTATSGTILVSLLDQNQNLVWNNGGVPLTINTVAPFPYRLNVGGLTALDDLTIQFQVNGDGNDAPILHSVDIGYQTRAHVPSEN